MQTRNADPLAPCATHAPAPASITGGEAATTLQRAPRRSLARRALLALCVIGITGCDFDIDFSDFDLGIPDLHMDFGDWSLGDGCQGTPGELGRGVFLFEQLPGRDHSAGGPIRFAVGTRSRFAVQTVDGDPAPMLSVDVSEGSGLIAALDTTEKLFSYGVRFLGPGYATLQMRGEDDHVWERVTLRVVAPASLGLQVGTAAMDPNDLLLLPTEDATRVLLAPGGELRIFSELLDGSGAPLQGVYPLSFTADGPHEAEGEGMVQSRWVGLDTRASARVWDPATTVGDATTLLTLRGPSDATGMLLIERVEVPTLASLEGYVHPGKTLLRPEEAVRVVAWGRTASGILAFGYPIVFSTAAPQEATVEPDPDHPGAALVRFHRLGTMELQAAYAADPAVSMTFTFQVVDPTGGASTTP